MSAHQRRRRSGSCKRRQRSEAVDANDRNERRERAPCERAPKAQQKVARGKQRAAPGSRKNSSQARGADRNCVVTCLSPVPGYLIFPPRSRGYVLRYASHLPLATFCCAFGAPQPTGPDAAVRSGAITKASSTRPAANSTFEGCWTQFSAGTCRVGDTPHVKIAFSSDAGASFNKPIQVDDGETVGRVDTLLLPDGSALVCWLSETLKVAQSRCDVFDLTAMLVLHLSSPKPTSPARGLSANSTVWR